MHTVHSTAPCCTPPLTGHSKPRPLPTHISRPTHTATQPHTTTPSPLPPCRLQLQDQLQEELTGDLLSMSAALKENVAGMHSAIEQRGKVLEQADVALDDSMANAKRSTARAKEQFQRWGCRQAGRRAAGGTCCACCCPACLVIWHAC